MISKKEREYNLIFIDRSGRRGRAADITSGHRRPSQAGDTHHNQGRAADARHRWGWEGQAALVIGWDRLAVNLKQCVRSTWTRAEGLGL
jgi:hypothetical protein